jgi:hypothetical protein
MTMGHGRSGRFFAATATGLVLAVSLVACASTATETPELQPTTAPPVAEIAPVANQEAALQDVRGCLAVNPVLNVFYLVDNSGSLLDTDPGMLRAQILADSLQSLANLGTGVTVNWAAGSFNRDFSLLRDWSPLRSAEEAQSLNKAIAAPNPRSVTNWEAAIDGARDSLTNQARSNPGCSMLIWFTDGLINLGDGAETEAAAERLCSGSSGSPSTLQQMRADQVVVFGVVLNRSDDGAEAAKSLIKLVEADPDEVDGVTGTCGVSSSADVRGTVTVVTAASDLADVFDGLSIVLDGGAPGEIDPTSGEFLIPQGVSRFLIHLAPRTGPWVLQAPNGQTLTQGDFDWPLGLEVSENAGGDRPKVEVRLTELEDSKEFFGTWTLVDHVPNSDELFRFSDLSVVLDDLEGANFGVVSGEGTAITGTVLDRDGNPANLGLFEFDWVVQERLPGESLPRELPSKTPGDNAARFTIDIGSTKAQPGDRMRVVVSLANMRTLDGSVSLEGPSASLPLTVLRPGQVPTGMSVHFSDAAGSSAAPARGELMATPPADGGAIVRVIIRNDAIVEVEDRFDRRFEITPDSSGCEPSDNAAAVCGEFSTTSSSVPLVMGIAEGEKSQYSSVSGQLLVELVVPPGQGNESSQPVRVIETLPFSLETERPINLALLIGLLFVLLIAGLTFPVVLAWVLKRGLVWFQHGRSLQRAEFPVAIKDGSLSLSTVSLADEAAVASEFRNLTTVERVRSHTDRVLGDFVIRVPWHPLAAAWFALTPPAGTRIISKQSGHAPQRFDAEVASGRLVATNGVLAGTWGVIVNDSDVRALESGAPLSGVLVVYAASSRVGPSQYAQMLREIMTADWRNSVLTLAQVVAHESARPDNGSVAAKTKAKTKSVPNDEDVPSERQRPTAPAAPSAPPSSPRPPGRANPQGSSPISSSGATPPRSPRDFPDNPSVPPRPPGR